MIKDNTAWLGLGNTSFFSRGKKTALSCSMNIPSLILATLVVLVVQQVKGRVDTKIPDPMCVSRRSSGRDIVYTDMDCQNSSVCPLMYPTYLISNETCVSDQHLGKLNHEHITYICGILNSIYIRTCMCLLLQCSCTVFPPTCTNGINSERQYHCSGH